MQTPVRLLAIVAVVVVVLAPGCAARRPINGRDIGKDQVRAIVPYETTEQEILDWFGRPTSLLRYPDGSKEYAYKYTGWIDRRVNLLVHSRTTTTKEHKKLSVRLDEGRVTGFVYTNSAAPGENVMK
jgi:hypothetical protein